MERFIIHLNVVDFAVAVERAIDMRLRDRPVLIAPAGSARATVYDMSEKAYRLGIRKGMPIRKAVRLCPDVRILPPHPDRYERAMRTLIKQALPYSPLIEPGKRDGHLFVDITGTRRLFGPPVDIAWRLRQSIRETLGLDPIWAIAPNKLLAKVATRLVKPIGECIVERGTETAFLAPLPIRLIPGIEREDVLKLQAFNLTRVFQVAALTPAQLTVPFGSRARFIHETVRGVDRSAVSAVGEPPLRIVLDHTFANDINDTIVLHRVLWGLVEAAGRRLRRRRLAGGRIGIILDYSDGVRCIRRIRIKQASANDFSLFQSARDTLNRAWLRRARIRRIGLTVDKLIFPPAQRELFPADRRETTKRTDLINAMDTIRNRFGRKALQMGRMLTASCAKS